MRSWCGRLIVTDLSLFARSDGSLNDQRAMTFQVTPEVAKQNLTEWSRPVRFKFERLDDGQWVMWLRAVPVPWQEPTGRSAIEIWREGSDG